MTFVFEAKGEIASSHGPLKGIGHEPYSGESGFTVATFNQILQKPLNSLTLIDCRPVKAFRKLHIPDSVHRSEIHPCKNDLYNEPVFIGDTLKQQMFYAKELRYTNSTFCSNCFSEITDNLLSFYDKFYTLKILAGKTGCGKSEILKKLQQQSQQIIDIEKIANHAGSVFGKLITNDKQPSVMQFRLNVAWKLAGFDRNKPIWMEQKARAVGSVSLTDGFLKQIESAPHYVIEADVEKRLERIIKIYGHTDFDVLLTLSEKIVPRLRETEKAIYEKAVRNRSVKELFIVLLSYYDSVYDFYLNKVNSSKFNFFRTP